MPLMTDAWRRYHNRVIRCKKCPRLIDHCKNIAKVKKRQYRDWTYWGKPVPSFGDHNARLIIVGLAPAAHGANRTGRMFTGDSSGDWLYRALYLHGFANQESSVSADDGLVLKDAFISATAHCAPPDNKPLREEVLNCEPYLDQEFDLLENKKIFLALGGIAFQATLKLLKRQGIEVGKPKFSHGGYAKVGPYHLLSSYHPSRQNTNTGRLTEKMWHSIFKKAQKELLKADAK